jgi:hypothetical protein
MGNPISSALASAQKAIDDSNDLSKSVTHQAGNTVDPTAPKKPLPPTSDYTHAHTARKAAAHAAPTTGDELAAKQRQVKEVTDASSQ